MNFIEKLFIFTSLVLATYAYPIDSCSEQASCLSVSVGACDADNNRQVCLSWGTNASCIKASDSSTTETVSHSCPGLGSTKDYNGDGSEDWAANDPICQTVVGGENAVFGVKDGSGCSDSGSYALDGLSDTATCVGPQNVCTGNNVKECLWTVPTDVCSTTGTFCPRNLVCNVEIPCSSLVDNLECPCSEYKFVHV